MVGKPPTLFDARNGWLRTAHLSRKAVCGSTIAEFFTDVLSLLAGELRGPTSLTCHVKAVICSAAKGEMSRIDTLPVIALVHDDLRRIERMIEKEKRGNTVSAPWRILNTQLPVSMTSLRSSPYPAVGGFFNITHEPTEQRAENMRFSWHELRTAAAATAY